MLQLNESQSVYHYQALPRSRVIRVLILFPGAGDDPIRVSLQVAFLDDEPEFEAISYVWGDPTSKKNIYCDDVCISVTANLHAALHNFRLQDKPRRLWADALCINQEDLDEKSFHVQMMHTVYQSCVRCLVWLGAPDAHSDTALALVQAITLLYTQHLGIAVDQADRHLDQHGRDPMLAQKIDFNGLPPKDSEQWSSLFQFLCRPWFSRVWVSVAPSSLHSTSSCLNRSNEFSRSSKKPTSPEMSSSSAGTERPHMHPFTSPRTGFS